MYSADVDIINVNLVTGHRSPAIPYSPKYIYPSISADAFTFSSSPFRTFSFHQGPRGRHQSSFNSISDDF